MSKLDKAYSSIEKKDGHWLSTIYVDTRQFVFRFRHEGRWFNLLHVLWHSVFGRKPGGGGYNGLSRACDEPMCVNPYHFRDGSDRQQLAWKEQWTMVDLEGYGFEPDSLSAMSIIDIVNASDCAIAADLGLTNDFGCYKCGNRFDPIVSRNTVICDGCWTDEDEAVKVRNNEEA